jgi:hypothetical protein
MGDRRGYDGGIIFGEATLNLDGIGETVIRRKIGIESCLDLRPA